MQAARISSDIYRAWKSSYLSLLKKQLSKMKIINFSWIHQRNEIAEQSATLKYGKTSKSREVTVEICLLGAKLLDS